MGGHVFCLHNDCPLIGGVSGGELSHDQGDHCEV